MRSGWTRGSSPRVTADDGGRRFKSTGNRCSVQSELLRRPYSLRLREKKQPVLRPAASHQDVAAIRERDQTFSPRWNWVGYFADAGCRSICFDVAVEARAPAGKFTTASASALSGIFPARHWSINALCCDNALSPPPLFGPAPLSTESVKHVSQVRVWLSLANTGVATPGVASRA